MLDLSAKSASLLAGLFQQAALVLIIRYSKTRHQEDNQDIPYLTSVAVMSAEVVKLCLSYVLEVITATSKTDAEDDASSQSSASTEEEAKTLLNASPRKNDTDLPTHHASQSKPSASTVWKRLQIIGVVH
jgi:uncharacterized membrane protein YhfC